MPNVKRQGKIIYFICIILISVCYPSYSQDSDGGREGTANVAFSLPSNTGKEGGTVTLGGVPVNLYTGAASPSLSLYTLPSRSLSVPLSLVYTAGSGVQVVSRASEVGTGWQLNAGGEISCEVRGGADELATDNLWLQDLMDHTSLVARYNYFLQLFCAGGDTEYDLYHLNALGLQVDFVVRKHNRGYDVHVLNNRHVQVTPRYATSGNLRRIVAFTVTDGSGTRYSFEQSTSTRVRSQTRVNRTGELWPASDITYTSAWQLTSVTSLTGDAVSFGYESGTAAPIVYKTMMERYKTLICDENGNNCTTYAPRRDRSSQSTAFTELESSSDYVTTVTVSHPFVRRLAVIITAAGQVSLIRGRHARRDAPGEYALSEMQVKDQNNRLIKRFHFDYAYFGPAAATSPDEVRLKLVQVKEQASGCAATATRFSYKETTTVSRAGALRDYWGYFTQRTPTGTRSVYLPIRTPHATAMQNCLLERITTSAGSATELLYEPHLDQRGTLIGGVRLKQVVVRDGFRAAADQIFEVGYTVFDPNNPGVAGGPSSMLVEPPRYEEYQETYSPESRLCDRWDDVVMKYLFTSTDPLEPIAPDYISYQWANVRFPNGSRSVYKFTNHADFPDVQHSASTKMDTKPYDTNQPCHSQQVNLPPDGRFIGCDEGDPRSSSNRGLYIPLPAAERPYGIKSSAAHRRGIVLEQYELDAESRPVTVTVNSYDFSHRDVALSSAVVAKEQEVFAYQIFNWYYNIKFYDLEREWTPLQEQLVTAYDQRRGNTQAIAQTQQRTTYEYANYLLAAVTTGRPTDGKRYRTQYLRVADYAPGYRAYPPGVRELYDKHNRTTILSTEQFLQPAPGAPLQRTTRVIHEYQMHNNVPVPSRTVNYDYVAGGSRPVGQNSAAAVIYDNQNNLVNALAPNGIWSGTVYGYNQLLPIASVINGRVGTSASTAMGVATPNYTSFETDGGGGWSAGASYATEAKTGQRSVQLSAASAMYGPGNFFTLEPTDQHGKYIFSCWAKVPQAETGQSNVTMVTVVHLANGSSIWRGTTTTVGNSQGWVLCRGILDLEDPAIRASLTNTQSITVQSYPWISAGSGNILVDEMRFHAEKDWLSTQAPTTPGSATAGHTSFETDGDDGWQAAAAYAPEAKTGRRSVQLSAASAMYGPGKTFTIEPRDQHGKYVFSCWAKVPQGEGGGSALILVTVVGVPSGQNTGKSTLSEHYAGQDWQLCRTVLDLDDPAIRNTLPANENITIQCFPYVPYGQGNVLVDEYRFHPQNARMTTSTYQPFVGKTSTTDANGSTTYFVYDDNNELRLVRDAKGQIVKRTTSHIAAAPDITVQVATTGGNTYPGSVLTFTATVPDCVEGVTYTWNFGDGTSRQRVGAEQTHTYQQVGNYAVTVVAEAPGVQPVETTHSVQIVSQLVVGAWYYGTNYYDLCNANGGDRAAAISAVPTGGCGSYTYRWQTSEPDRWSGQLSEWADAGNTGDTFYYYHNSPRVLYTRCIVTDACGNVAEVYNGFNTYYSDPYCTPAQQW